MGRQTFYGQQLGIAVRRTAPWLKPCHLGRDGRQRGGLGVITASDAPDNIGRGGTRLILLRQWW